MQVNSFQQQHIQPFNGIRKPSAISFSFLVAVAIIIFTTVPYFLLLAHGLVGIWALFSLWLASIALENHTKWRQLFSSMAGIKFELAMLLCWILVILINMAFEHGNPASSMAHLNSSFISFCYLFLAIYYTFQDEKKFQILALILLITLGLEALRSLPHLVDNYHLTRQSMSGNLETYAAAARLGLEGYSVYTANAIAFPCLIVFASRQKGFLRTLLLSACAFIGIAVLLASFMGAFSLLLIGIIIYFLFAAGGYRKKWIPISLIALFLLSSFVVYQLYLSKFDQVIRVRDKMERLYSGVSSYGIVQGDQTDRGRRFMLSWDTFQGNPFLGVGAYTQVAGPELFKYIGGHSSWIDQLAEYGVLGFGFYLLFIIAVGKRLFKEYLIDKGSPIKYGRLTAWILFLICGLVNPVLFQFAIMALFYFLVVGSSLPDIKNFPARRLPSPQRTPRLRASSGV